MNLSSLALHQPNKVGSIHSNKLNYHRRARVFGSNLIPDSSKRAASEVRKSIVPDILGLETPKWHKSTYIDRKPYSEQISQSRLLFEIHSKLREQPVFKYRPNKIYPGTEGRDQYTGWNVSVEVNRKEINHKLEEMNKSFKEKSTRTNQRILKNYHNPTLSQSLFMKQVREQKDEDEALKAHAREEYIYQYPTASEEKIASNVFKMVAMHKLKQKQYELAGQLTKDETFTPDLKRTLRNSKVKVYKHDGAWNQHSWSCCMSEDFNSRGCVATVKDTKRWQTMSM